MCSTSEVGEVGEVGQLGCGGVTWGWEWRVGERKSIKGCGKSNPCARVWGLEC